jgi:hypothetical protein
MGRVADARQQLADVLEPVWPGRVRPYPPTRPTPTAGVYVGTLSAGWGDNVTWTATFTVALVADGANHAAHALLDDLVDKVYDAIAGSATCYPGAVTFEAFPVDDVTELPAYLFTVDVELSSLGWCAPDPPSAALIPPVPIGASTP